MKTNAFRKVLNSRFSFDFRQKMCFKKASLFPSLSSIDSDYSGFSVMIVIFGKLFLFFEFLFLILPCFFEIVMLWM